MDYTYIILKQPVLQLVDTTPRPEESDTGKMPMRTCLAWSSDGATLFAGLSDNLICIYNVTSI